MKQTNVYRFAFVLLIALAYSVHAVPDLRLTVQGQNVILNWPSQAGQSFVVEHRANLDDATPWVRLETSYPAAPNGPRTTFTHTGVVLQTIPGTGGTGGNSGAPPVTGSIFRARIWP